MRNLAEEMENASENLFSQEREERDYDAEAQEIASRHPGISWSCIRTQLEYLVLDLEKIDAE